MLIHPQANHTHLISDIQLGDVLYFYKCNMKSKYRVIFGLNIFTENVT